MKKKRILLGIALASASIFALASCGGKNDNTPNDDEQKDTSGSGSQSGDSGQQGGGEQTVTKYSITYNVNGHGTAPANKTDVTAITDADLAAISAPGYLFEGWFTDAALTQAATAGNISTNTTLYAKWYGASYEAVKEKGGVALDEQFNEQKIIPPYFSYMNAINTTRIYFVSSVHQDKPNSPASTYDYNIADNKLTLVDGDADKDGDTKGSAKAIVNFGNTPKAEILEGYVDVTIPVKNNNWTFFQLYGTDTAKTNSEIFGLRTVEETVDKTKKTFIQYRIDGTLKSEGIINKFEVTDNTSFGIHLVINQVTGKITVDLVKADGTVLPFIKDVEIPGYVLSTRYLFTSTDGGNKVLSFTNVVLRAEKEITDVAQYKAKVLAYFNPALSEMAPRYVTNKTQFEAARDAIVAAVEGAETIDAIDAIVDISSQESASPEMIALMSVEDELTIKRNYINENYPEDNYTIKASDYYAAWNNLYRASTIDELNAAVAAFANVKNDEAAKADYIDSKVAELQALLPASNYTFEDTKYNNKPAYDSAIASITGNNKNDIDESYSQAITTIANIKTNALLLSFAKSDYITLVGNYKTDLTGKTVSSSEQTAIAEYYGSTAEDSSYNTKKATAASSINAAETLDAIKSAYSTFTSGVDTDINGIVMSLDDYKADRKNQIENVDAPNYKEYQDDDIIDLIDAAVTEYCGNIDSATSKEAVKTAYDACIAQFDLIYYKRDARANYRKWITDTYFTAGAEKQIKTTKYAVLKEFDTVDEEAIQAIFAANSEADVDTAVVNGQSAYEAEYQALLTYQFDVDFENVELTSVKVVYGNTLTQPTDPTVADDKLFIGWYADSTFTTPFDFTQPIYEDTTLYAKIVDAVTVTLNYNATINNVTTKSVKIESGTTISSTELNVTQDDAMLFDWYQNADFSGAAFTSTTVVNTNTQIYARWCDTVSNLIGFNNPTAMPTIAGWSFTGMVVQATSIKGVDIDGNEKSYTSSLKFGGDSKNTRYISFTLNTQSTVFLAIMGGGNGDRSVFINQTAPGSSKASALDQTYIYATSSSQAFASAKQVLPAGTYYVQTYGGDCRIVALQVVDTKTVSGLTATLTPETGAISISDVKLSVSGSSDPISITEGYSVYLDEETTPAVITDGKIAASSGEHTVTIKYGKYTVYLDSVTVE